MRALCIEPGDRLPFRLPITGVVQPPGRWLHCHRTFSEGQPEQALVEIRRARTLDALSLIINIGVGWCYYHAHRYDEAIQQYKATLELNPNLSLTHVTLAMAYEGKQLYSDAISEYNKGLALRGSRPFALAGLGRAYVLSGKLERHSRCSTNWRAPPSSIVFPRCTWRRSLQRWATKRGASNG